MSMSSGQRLRFWLIGGAVFLVLLYMLRGVMLPFVAGMAVAYFLDPLADRMERAGLSRTLATGIICLVFFGVLGIGLTLLAPVIQSQVVTFVQKVPTYAQSLHQRALPLLEEVYRHLSPEDLDKLRASAGAYAGTAVEWGLGVVKGVLSGGIAAMSILSLLFITPVVTFYLLRDWDHMVVKVDHWLPRHHADTIRHELKEIDRTIAGFVRGQAMVCMILAVFYGVGLTLTGLDLGLMIGLGTGLGAFVPYVGMLIGLIASVGLALAQGGEWHLLGGVGVVFLFGNILEGNFLTPKLVGDRVGLHPVWIIFSLLAGGALFGFVGILLAVPAASVIGVLVRFALQNYMRSSLYDGIGDDYSKS
ncbi:putative permease (PerM family) [Magnetospirillum sp. XM-1]|nr:putative permease (PerM family) [Magnetospirillum sp. XM-1]